MSAPSCPRCGVVLLRHDGSPLNHQPDTNACKVRCWAIQCDERDLVRVSGELAIEVERFGIAPVYGPVFTKESFWNGAAVRRKVPLLESFDEIDRRGDGRSVFVTGVFVPRWAAVLGEFAPGAGFGLGRRLRAAFERCPRDADFAAVFVSVGMLLEDSSDRRSAVAALLLKEIP